MTTILPAVAPLLRRWWSLPLFAMLMSPIGCGKPGAARADPLQIRPSAATPTAPSAAAEACKVAETIEATEPEATDGGPASSHLYRWYTNPDRSIWMFAGIDLLPGKSSKVAWFRSPGAQLEVTGRRLDGAAPPLLFEVAPGSAYPHRFTPSGMTFPTQGCWEIVAQAGAGELRFVIAVPSTGHRGDAG